MSDSKMFTGNKMPDGYDKVWKAFAKAWIKSKRKKCDQFFSFFIIHTFLSELGRIVIGKTRI